MNFFEKVRADLDKDRDLGKCLDEAREQTAYLDDPSISDHDKELQWALDQDMEDPDDRDENLRKELADLDVYDPKWPNKLMRYNGYNSLDDVREELQRLLSPEEREIRRSSYIRHCALVEEALRSGFTKGGRCRNVRRG